MSKKPKWSSRVAAKMPMPMRKLLPPNLHIEEMLKRKTMEQLLEDGDIYTVEAAAPIMRYHPMHLLKKCRRGTVERIECPTGKRRWFLYARTVHGSRPQHAALSARRAA